jgi:hypothetical protein
LKGHCLLATKTDVNELFASTSVAYALVCKDALISIQDMQQMSTKLIEHDMRVNGPKLKLRTTRILRPCSFVSDWWVGTIPTRIASLIYINFD